MAHLCLGTEIAIGNGHGILKIACARMVKKLSLTLKGPWA